MTQTREKFIQSSKILKCIANEFFSPSFFEQPLQQREGGTTDAAMVTYFTQLYGEVPFYLPDWFNRHYPDIKAEDRAKEENIDGLFRREDNPAYLLITKQCGQLADKFERLCKDRLGIDIKCAIEISAPVVDARGIPIVDERGEPIFCQREMSFVERIKDFTLLPSSTAVTFYSATKYDLEALVYLLEKNEFNLSRAKSSIEQLKSVIDKCLSGLTAHIPAAVGQIVSANFSDPKKALYNVRFNVIQEFAKEYIQSKNKEWLDLSEVARIRIRDQRVRDGKKNALPWFADIKGESQVHYVNFFVLLMQYSLNINQLTDSYVEGYLKDPEMQDEFGLFISSIDNTKLIYGLFHGIEAVFEVEEKLFAEGMAAFRAPASDEWVGGTTPIDIFLASLAQLGPDPYCVLETFYAQCEKKNGAYVESDDGAFCALRHSVHRDNKHGSSLFIDSYENMLKKIESTIFERLWTGQPDHQGNGYINKDKCKRHLFKIDLEYGAKIDAVAYYSEILKKVIFSCNVFDLFKEMTAVAQLDFIEKCTQSNELSASIRAIVEALLHVMKPEALWQLTKKYDAIKALFYELAIEQNNKLCFENLDLRSASFPPKFFARFERNPDLQLKNFRGAKVGRDFVTMVYGKGGRRFSGLDLSEADLSGLHFDRVNFSECTLKNTNFTNTTFSRCQFNHEDMLLGAKFYHNKFHNTLFFKKVTATAIVFNDEKFKRYLPHIKRTADGNDVDVLATCQDLLQREYLKGGRLGRFFSFSLGRNHIPLVEEALKEIRDSSIKNIKALRGFITIRDGSLKRTGELHAIIEFCLALEREKMRDQASRQDDFRLAR